MIQLLFGKNRLCVSNKKISLLWKSIKLKLALCLCHQRMEVSIGRTVFLVCYQTLIASVPHLTFWWGLSPIISSGHHPLRWILKLTQSWRERNCLTGISVSSKVTQYVSEAIKVILGQDRWSPNSSGENGEEEADYMRDKRNWGAAAKPLGWCTWEGTKESKETRAMSTHETSLHSSKVTLHFNTSGYGFKLLLWVQMYCNGFGTDVSSRCLLSNSPTRL